MSKHDDDTCPHLVRASLIEAENARLQAEVDRLRKHRNSLIERLDKAIEALNAANEGTPSV